MTGKEMSRSSCCGTPSLGSEGVDLLRSELPDLDAAGAAVNLFAMAGNPVRLRLLLALARREELCVCDLAELVGMTSAAVSAHLQKVKLSGIVRSRRDGKMIRYSLVRRSEIEALESLLASMEASG